MENKPIFFIVSNEIAEQAVISPVSGYIFEKRLLLKYIQENGTDPMSNEALNPEQLIEVKCNIFTHVFTQISGKIVY